MAEHTLELFAIHDREQPGGAGDRRLLRARAGGEGIRRGVVDDVDLRHRQSGADRQRRDDVVQHRRLLLRHRLRTRDGEDGLLTEGQRPEHHEQGHDRGDDDARDAPADARRDVADHVADRCPDDEEGRDHDHALALVAGDLVIHRLHYATADAGANRCSDQESGPVRSDQPCVALPNGSQRRGHGCERRCPRGDAVGSLQPGPGDVGDHRLVALASGRRAQACAARPR